MLPPHQRYALHHGPYHSPRVRIGDVITCERLGDCVVPAISTAPIPWPKGRRKNGPKSARASVLLCGSLVDAVRNESNQAVAANWQVNGSIVSRRRAALDVPHWWEATRRTVKDDVDRAEKIAENKSGKPRLRTVIEAMRKGRTGKPHDEATRAKMSEAHQRCGTRPPAAGKPFTDAEDEVIRTYTGVEAARILGRSLDAIYSRRRLLGLPDGRRRKASS